MCLGTGIADCARWPLNQTTAVRADLDAIDTPTNVSKRVRLYRGMEESSPFTKLVQFTVCYFK